MPQQTIPYDLRQHANTYRVTVDESFRHETFASDKAWLHLIPCRYGHIYVHGTNVLGAFASGSRIATRLLSLPGVTRHQVGNGEASVTFPLEMLDVVADLLRAKKRRKPLSPEARAAAAARVAPFAFKHAPNSDTSGALPRVGDAGSASA